MRKNRFTSGCAHTDWLNSGNPADVEEHYCSFCNEIAEVVESADEDGCTSHIHCENCEAQLSTRGDISISLLEQIELEGIDVRDYPDFVDAYIGSAEWKSPRVGKDKKLTEEQLCRIPSEQVHELVHDRMH
jgi:transcription elongation factor Elf1